MLSKKTLKRMSAYVAKLDASTNASALKLAPSKQAVTASSLKAVVAQLREDASSVSKVYAGLKKVLSNRVAYAKAAKMEGMAKVLSDLAVVATKIDLVMAVAESELADEVDTDNLDAEDILNDLQEDTGVDMGDEAPEGAQAPEADADENRGEEAEGEGEPDGDEGEPDGDEGEPDGDADGDELPEFEAEGEEDEGDEDTDFGDDFDPADLFPEGEEDEGDDDVPATAAKPATASTPKAAKASIQAKAKATTVAKSAGVPSGIQLFNFVD